MVLKLKTSIAWKGRMEVIFAIGGGFFSPESVWRGLRIGWIRESGRIKSHKARLKVKGRYIHKVFIKVQGRDVTLT